MFHNILGTGKVRGNPEQPWNSIALFSIDELALFLNFSLIIIILVGRK